MVEVAMLDGVTVEFPFEPYACQVEFMRQVTSALQTKSNALLESPTGTGKTLCLLCACVAWTLTMRQLNTNQNDDYSIPRIYYASRTHSQLSQAVRELKRTAYASLVQLSVLGSRQQLCIHDSVRQVTTSQTAQTAACRAMVSQRQCHFHANVSANVSYHHHHHNQLMDIEELVQYGIERRVCPYYLSRETQRHADITFLPYNYLVDPQSRATQNISVDNAILIFDEAHNLESSCNEASSFELTTADLQACLVDLNYCSQVQQEPDLRAMYTREDVDVVRVLIEKFRERLHQLPLTAATSSGFGHSGTSQPNRDKVAAGSFVLQLMAEVGITFHNVDMLVDMCNQFISAMAIISNNNNTTTTTSSRSKSNTGLGHWVKCLKLIFAPEHRASHHHLDLNYKTYIQEWHPPKRTSSSIGWTSTAASSSSAPGRSLSFWCFSSGVAMKSLLEAGCRSIILTSGTLAPLSSFATELQIPLRYTLENPHVIAPDQIHVRVLPVGPGGVRLNSSYKNRESVQYKHELGSVIVRVVREVVGGVLVFFPSYGVMESCLKAWQTASGSERCVWDRIKELKEPFAEPRDKSDFGKAMDDFYSRIASPDEEDTSRQKKKGAVFFAVCRGKASEGIDFSNARGRAVVITGLPFPNVGDMRVKLKRKFLDDLHALHQQRHTPSHAHSSTSDTSNLTTLSGGQWYLQQGARAVNQAIGRVIRHKNDWGAILLCDERFAEPQNVRMLPRWIREYVQVEKRGFEVGMAELAGFVRRRAEVEAQERAVRRVTGGGDVGEGGRKQKKESAGALGGPGHKMKLSDLQNLMPNVGAAMSGAMGGGGSLIRTRMVTTMDQVGGGSGGGARGVRANTTVTSMKRKLEDPKESIAYEHHHCPPIPSVRPQQQQKEISISMQDIKNRPRKLPKAPAGPALQTNAQSYLTQLKSLLPRADYKKFQSCIREYKEAKVNTTEVIARLEALFGTRDYFGLFRGVGPFLPRQVHEMFQRRADEMERRFGGSDSGGKGGDPRGDGGKCDEDEVEPRACCICNKTKPEQPFESPCRHVACHECWVIWFDASDGSCAYRGCDRKVKFRQLKKVYFYNSKSSTMSDGLLQNQ